MRILGQMSPYFIVNDHADERSAATKFSPDFRIGNSSSAFEISDLDNLIISQFGKPVVLPFCCSSLKHMITMLLVLRRRAPFKVFQMVIRWISIFVINEWLALWVGANKRPSHQSVNWELEVFPFVEIIESNAEVFFGVCPGGHDPLSIAFSSMRFYFSMIANAVALFPSGHGLPATRLFAVACGHYSKLSQLLGTCQVMVAC